MNANHTREQCAARDASDPLATHRAQFHLPAGLIYLDGNSLGPLPHAARGRLAQTMEGEWGDGLIRSWFDAPAGGWIGLPRRIGDKIARLIGAQPGEVIVADSTSLNLFKALAGALKLTTRPVMLSERGNFPTDLYMAQGLIDLLGARHELRLADAEDLAGAIDHHTGVLMLTHVNYRSGRMHDLAGLTARAHAQGALVIWDLSHSTGAVPLDLTAAQADFAVGCGYKYLNGGPGAPAFIYVAQRHHAAFSQPLSGWMGHARPFAFDGDYQPAAGIERALCGTPPVLGLAALECGVDSVLAADMALIRAKSLALTDLFIERVENRCADPALTIATPRPHHQRGSQVCLRHPRAGEIMQRLIARGVIGDYRPPDILRFGFAPLYVRYVDVWDAVEHLAGVLDGA